MLEIKAEILSRVVNDSTISGLLPSSAKDNRVYAWNPGMDIEYSEKDKGAVFYRTDIEEERSYLWSYPSQIPSMYLFFRVVAINPYIAEQISERIISLFDLSSIKTDNWRVPFTELVSYKEGDVEGTPSFVLFVRNIVFFLRAPLKR